MKLSYFVRAKKPSNLLPSNSFCLLINFAENDFNITFMNLQKTSAQPETRLRGCKFSFFLSKQSIKIQFLQAKFENSIIQLSGYATKKIIFESTSFFSFFQLKTTFFPDCSTTFVNCSGSQPGCSKKFFGVYDF